MLAVVLAVFSKLVVILKLGSRSIWKRITSFMFLNIYNPPQHVLSHINLCFKIIDKVKPKFNLKIKEALHINWRKPNLNAQQNHLARTLLFPLLLFVFVCFSFGIFCISLSCIVLITSTLNFDIFYCLNYTLLLLYLFMTHLVIDFKITM